VLYVISEELGCGLRYSSSTISILVDNLVFLRQFVFGRKEK
jgi:hypothetical protein